MRPSNPSAHPIFGTLSVALAPLGLLLVALFAAGSPFGESPSRQVIVFAQSLLIVLLGGGLHSGLAGLLRGEQPRARSLFGVLLTIAITLTIALFFASLDD
jgi:hypothetical protein